MDTAKTPLLANLDRALRKAYTGAGASAELPRAEADAPVPEKIGRYRVRGVIARGGMGAVLRAEDPELGRDVAVKVSRSHDPALLALFANEARICSQLQHPGIVPVYERGRTEDGRPYYVMKLIEGETLATLLGARASPADDAARMLEIFMAVCQTMAYVHARGVFHGDLKPGNVMVGAFGEVQVMDWGIADGGTVTGPREGARPLAVGTPAYMPPERARADQGADGIRADVFSLGAMLCEILTGEPPYRGSDRSEIFRRAVSADLDDAFARLAACGADAALVSLARDGLAARPEDRPADAEAVARRVADHVAAVGKRARDAELELAGAHAKHLSERRARRLTLALAATVILGLVAGGTGFFLLDREKRTRQADSARLVDEALVEAHKALAEAQVAQPPDPERWAHAETAALRAVTLAERQQADSATLERAQTLKDDTHRLREDRLRQVSFQERIEDIEHHGLEEDRASDWLDAAYRDAFRSAGLDPAALDAKLADENARTFLGLALSRWALARRRVPRSGDSARSLLEAAMRVDPDPDRRGLCAAFLAGDHDALLKAARPEGKLLDSPESLVLLSRFLIDLGHAEEATAVLRVACEKHPGDFRAHHDLAARLGAEKKPPYDEIIRLLSMCVAVRPSSAHALTDLGGAYHLSEMPDLAAEALRRATALQPSHPRGWVVLATILRDQGEVDLARDAARAGIACETDPDGLSRFAVQFWNRGLVDVAEEAFRKAIAAKPEHLGARLGLGELELSRGAYEAALVHFRGATETAPKLAGAWKGLGRALAGVMNWGDAADALGRASELGDTSPDLPATLGRLWMLAGNTERALEVLELAPGLDDRALGDARRAANIAKPAEAIVHPRPEDASGGSLVEINLDAARVCMLRGWFAFAASCFQDPLNGDMRALRGHRMVAARAAALAGRGFALDAKEIGAEARAAFRGMALGWAREELGVLRRAWEADHLEGPRVRAAVRAIKLESALPSEQRPDFAALPEADRAAWTSFWKEADRLLSDLDALALPAGASVRLDLSARKLGITGPLAGAQFSTDGQTLYLVSNAGSKAGCVHALPVRRDDASKAITGFGPPRLHAAAAHADGGLALSQDGALYWSTWREHELGELPPGGKPSRFPLAASGVPAGGGGLAFVPRGEAAGGLLMSSYADGGLYRVDLTEPSEGARTPVPGSAKLVVKLRKGTEGVRFAPSARLGGSLLVCNWDAGVVTLTAVNPETGLPYSGPGQWRNFVSGVEGVSGLDFDPVSGDLLLTSWGSGNRVLLLTGL